jgi:arylsulfatase A-like enzyme
MSIDFYPTLLEIAGASDSAGDIVDGVSLTSLLHGQREFPEERPLFWHYPHYSNQGGFPGGAVRIGDWKLVERYEDGRVHLYNLAGDIGERTDLADNHPDRIADMRNRLHRWYETVDAKFLQPKDDNKPWRP